MYSCMEQSTGRERRDVSWWVEAPEWCFPGPVATKTPRRQPWCGGEGRYPNDRSAASVWGLLPLGQTFRWSLPGATEHLEPQHQSSQERGLGCQGLEGFRGREVLGSWSWGSGDREVPVFQLGQWCPPWRWKGWSRLGKEQIRGRGQASMLPGQGWLHTGYASTSHVQRRE